MTTAVMKSRSSVIQFGDQIQYLVQSLEGGLSKVLLQHQFCQYTLFCLAAGTEIAEQSRRETQLFTSLLQ
jgi:dTDP-glucose pyrophosphorylase